jgi:Sulfatase
MAAAVFGGDWLRERREAARSVPPAGTPNVLLIVLDTVRADRMSLYGYPRSTTPALERLAQRGIRFAKALIWTDNWANWLTCWNDAACSIRPW